jgi:hypothetical protein
LKGLVVRYCYCSAFDSCWLAENPYGKLRNLNPPQVAVCPRPKVAYSNHGD